jgi:NAD(P)-dependent dehydrogenase (short-subunit alcohol dehydrogenase family)
VLGAGGGIGRAVCRGLYDGGANLAVADLSAEVLTPIVTELGDDVVVAAGDASDLAVVAGIVADVERAAGPIDVLINVAGAFSPEPFEDSDPESWHRAINVNLLTVMASCRAVLPGMLERGSGSIVTFASTAGEYGSIRPAAAYAAAKGAVIAFTKSLAREMSPRGVRVNCVSPGPIETAMFGGATSAGSARTLVGRMGTPEDLVAPVLYLASRQSTFVTGEVLRVNGGSLI